MRLASLRLLVAFVLIVGITSCGGGDNSTKVGEPAKVTVTPSAVSLNFGQFTTLVVIVQDANNAANRTAAVTVQSSNTAVATVRTGTDPSSGGTLIFVCAGQWNLPETDPPTLCTPATTPGNANITATAGNITSTPTVVTVHSQVANLTIAPVGPAPACISQTGAVTTQAYVAKAFNAAGTDITAQVGTITYISSDTTVATIDGTTGVATARRPGKSNIFASIAGVNSPTATFVTCAPQLIWIQSANVTPSETSFLLAAAATKQLAPSVTDTSGNSISDPGLTWSSSNRGVATVSQTGLVTAVAPGTARIVATCAPSACNNNTNQLIFSNVVTVSVSGTLSPRAYVTGTNSTTVVPIDPATNTAGTAVTIPQIAVNGTNTQPVLANAMFSPDGARLFIGTDLALFTFDPGTNQFLSSNNAAPGRILTVSPNGRVAVADPTSPTVRIYDNASAAVVGSATVSTPVAAAFTPDGSKLIIAGAQGLTIAAGTSSFTQLLSQAPKDVAVLNQGSITYVAGGAPSTLSAFATCNFGVVNNGVAVDPHLQDFVGITGDPQFVEATDDSSRVIAVDKTSIYEIGVTLQTIGCPPTANHSLVAANFGAGTFTPRQLIVAQAGDKAFVVSNLNSVLAYDAVTNTASTIPLAAGATSAFSGGLLPDGSQLYVGAAGTNDVHRIDVAAGTDAQQIAVNLKDKNNAATAPDIVVVKPR